jgi:hypothetical protein
MSRFFTDDFINKDPRALLNSAKMATISDLVTPSKQYLNATGAAEITIDAGCVIAIAGGGVFNTTLTHINASNLDTGTFTVGKDYYVYLCDPGSNNDEIYVISLNSKCRTVNSMLQPVDASGAVQGTGWESTVFDGVVPRSVWTLAHRPKCTPEGMVFLNNNTWVDIYLNSDDGANGLKSAYNATPMTGTEGLNWYSFVERALKSGKRLLSYAEFCAMAYGSPQGDDADNNNAWSATTNTGRQLTGYVANAVSSIGCRDAVGNVWEWLSDLITNASNQVITGNGTFGASDGDRAGKAYTGDNGHGTTGAWNYDTTTPFSGHGNILEYADYSLIALLGGGGWLGGSRAGSRAVILHYHPWYTNVSFGARLGCDSL